MALMQMYAAPTSSSTLVVGEFAHSPFCGSCPIDAHRILYDSLSEVQITDSEAARVGTTPGYYVHTGQVVRKRPPPAIIPIFNPTPGDPNRFMPTFGIPPGALWYWYELCSRNRTLCEDNDDGDGNGDGNDDGDDDDDDDSGADVELTVLL